tara:strand:+ start:371 stop:571 length:201 start_codon:yes stop_codon:yes gene_type:complete
MSEITIKGGIEIEVTTILKTVNYRDNPIITTYYEMTINGNEVGSNEMNRNQVDWYTENYEAYINQD